MENTINAAIQVLPGPCSKPPYEIIDEAIRVIRDSGLTYEVCPFETVIEGKYEEVISLLADIRDKCFSSGADEILINVKLQIHKTQVISIEDKMKNYRNL